MTIAGLLFAGMGLALLGSVKVPLARKLQMDEARVGGLVSLFGFTMIPVILAAGVLADLVGRQMMFISGGLLLSVALATLALARSYRTALLAVLLFSAAWSAQANVLNVITPAAFLDPADIPAKNSYATNLGNVFFGLGAFLTPLAVSLTWRRFGLSATLYAAAALVLLPTALAAGTDFALPVTNSTEPPAAGESAASATAMLLRNPVMWACASAFFCYAPLEAAMAAWSTTYLAEKGFSEAGASSLLSGFWLCFLASRLMTALWVGPWLLQLTQQDHLPATGETLLIAALALASIVVLAGVARAGSSTMAAAMVLAAGLVLGPIFPSILAIVLGAAHHSVQGRAIGVFFAIGGLGWTIIPMLIGAYARRTSVQRGFLIGVAAAFGLFAAGIMLVGIVPS